MAKVSIIMNCYNSDKYLKDAIDSIYAQTYTDWEVIFWDNQSTDRSAIIAQSYDEKLKYFYADEFLPLGAARNKALEKANGEYIAFLDCDDEWLPSKLEMQMRCFASDSEVDFIYSNSYRLDMKYNKKSLAHKCKQPEGYIFDLQLQNYSVLINTVILNKTLLFKVDDLFNVQFNIIEEYDLFMRMFLYAKVKYISEPLAIYRIHGRNTSILERARYIEEMKVIVEQFQGIVNNDLKSLEDICNIEELKLAASKGDNRRAQTAFKNITQRSIELRTIWLLSLLPSKLSMFLYKIMNDLYKRYVIYH